MKYSITVLIVALLATTLNGQARVGASLGPSPGFVVADLGAHGWYRANLSDKAWDHYAGELDWSRLSKQMSVFSESTLVALVRASIGPDKYNPIGWPTEDMPEFREAYVTFCSELAQHCGNVIDIYQIGEEVHWSHQWPLGRYDELASLITECRDVILDADPTARIALGGFGVRWLLDKPEKAVPRFQEILTACSTAGVDVLDLHYHFRWDEYARVIDGTIAFRLVHPFAATMPIMATENSTWSGDPPGDDPEQTEQQQAVYAFWSIYCGLLMGVEGITGGSRRDKESWGGTGLYDQYDNPKPVAVVVKYWIIVTSE